MDEYVKIKNGEDKILITFYKDAKKKCGYGYIYNQKVIKEMSKLVFECGKATVRNTVCPRVGNSLICSLLFRSTLLIIKSELLSLLFKKDRCE